MDKKRILFICTHNSARSQMAEGLVDGLYGDGEYLHGSFEDPAACAGTEDETLACCGGRSAPTTEE